MKYFDWDDAKSAKLRAERSIGFEDVAFHIECGDLLDISEHRTADRYAGQRIFVVRRKDYVYSVPFPPSPRQFTPGLRRGLAEALRAEADLEDEHAVFLKTIIPSRKATKQYLGEESTMKLDADEKELVDSVERGEWKSTGCGERARARYSRYAKATFRKDRRLNIRLSSKDLEAIQKRALAEGLPY